jgi:ribose transport system substrate-binding protein
MSDSISPRRQSAVRTRLVIEVLLIAAVAVAVYFGFVRDRGPRHLNLAIVTWTEDPFWQPLLRGAQDYADKSNVELTIIKSKPTADVQTQHIRDLLDSGIDGIAISPNDAVAQHAILEEAASKVPVVTFDTDAPDTNRRRFISIDNYAAGRICAGEMSEAMPDGGPVLISVGSVTMEHGRQRRQGVIDALLERGFDRDRTTDPIDGVLKGPKFTVVYTATDGGDPATAVQAIAAGLRAHPEVKGIIGLFSYSAPAALQAIKLVGRTDQIQVVGFDQSDETQAALEAGTIHSSVLQDSYRCGYETIEVLANEARGVAPGPAEHSPILYVGINVITGKNLSTLRNSGAVDQPSGSPSTAP